MLRQKLFLTNVVIAMLLSAFAFRGTAPATDADIAALRIQSGSDAALSEKTAQFERTLEDLRRQLKIPGMSAAIVKDQELVWAQGFGYADLEAEREATPDTAYELASLTKTFASTILLQLMEQGSLDLDDPVSGYGVRIKSPGEIQVRHLLSHTSEGMPGSSFHYHGYRYGHLGKVIERASGRTFQSLLTENILNRLAMNDSVPIVSLDEPQYSHIAARLAKPYRLDQDFNLMPGVYEDHFTPSVGLVSTVVDMARYDIALDRNELISAKSKEMAFTPMVLSSGEQSPYGLGWFVQDFQGNKLVWHYGDNPGSFSSLILKVPEQGLTLIVFANTTNLSSPFWLGDGDVMCSPIAVAFYKLFILDSQSIGAFPEIPWGASEGEVVTQLSSAQDTEYGDVLRQELVSRYLIHNYFDDAQAAGRILAVHTKLFPHSGPAFIDLTPIAAIQQAGDNTYSIVEFHLERDTPVQIYAVGERYGLEMVDFGGIQDLETGKLIWHMTTEQTSHAGGGAGNRRAVLSMNLNAGAYRLHYRTDGGHSAARWLFSPPDDRFWGIVVYGEGDTQTVATTREFTPTSKDRLLESIHEPPVSTAEYVLLWSCAGILLSALILWPASGALRRFTKRTRSAINASKSAGRLMGAARWVAGVNGLLCLSYILAIAVGFGLEFMALHSVTSSSSLFIWERSLLAIPYLSIILSVLQVVFAIIAWSRAWWSLPGRLHYSLVTLAAAGYLLLLNYCCLIVPLL